jgi:hypothetical protein
MDSNGNFWATNATLTGDITAKTGYIGGTSGWVIETNKIYSGTKDNSNNSGDITLSTVNFKRTVNGTEQSNLRFAIGDKFAVAADGTLYASGANITSINATNITGGTLNFSNITVSNLSVNSIGGLNDRV